MRAKALKACVLHLMEPLAGVGVILYGGSWFASLNTLQKLKEWYLFRWLDQNCSVWHTSEVASSLVYCCIGALRDKNCTSWGWTRRIYAHA